MENCCNQSCSSKSEEALTESEIKDAYQDAQRRRSIARMSVSGLLLTTVCTFVYIGWSSISVFANNSLPEVAAIATNAILADRHVYLNQIQSAATSLSKTYKQEFTKALNKDMPKVERSVETELAALEQHLQKRWPQAEKEIALLASDQKDLLEVQFKHILGEERGTRLAAAYGEAISNRVSEAVQDEFRSHGRSARNIGRNLHKITELETDIPQPIDEHEALGLLLELVGLHLQEMRVS